LQHIIIIIIIIKDAIRLLLGKFVVGVNMGPTLKDMEIRAYILNSLYNKLSKWPPSHGIHILTCLATDSIDLIIAYGCKTDRHALLLRTSLAAHEIKRTEFPYCTPFELPTPFIYRHSLYRVSQEERT